MIVAEKIKFSNNETVLYKWNHENAADCVGIVCRLGATLDSYANVDQRGVEGPVIVVIVRHALTRTAIASILRRELAEFELMELAASDDLNRASERNVRLIALDIGDRSIREPFVGKQIALITKQFPDVPLALLSSSDGEAELAIRGGVRGFFSTSISVDVAIAGLRLILAGGVYWPLPACASREEAPVCNGVAVCADMGEPDKMENSKSFHRKDTLQATIDLTPRERNVLEALELGLPNKLIALRLNLSENTVKMHVQHIMRKCFARNRTEAVLLWSGRLARANGDENYRKLA